MDFLALNDVLIGLFDYIREDKLMVFQIWDERYPLERSYALSIKGAEHVSILVSKSQDFYRFEATPDKNLNPKFSGIILIGPESEKPETYFNFKRLWQAIEYIHVPMNERDIKDELEYLIEKLMEKI